MNQNEINMLEELKEKYEGISFIQSRMPNYDDDPRMVSVNVAMTDKHWIGKDLLVCIFPYEEKEKKNDEE